MFGIEIGTAILVYDNRSNKPFTRDNMRQWTTQRFNVFDKEQLCIDPSGIATWGSRPGGVTIGSAWAGAGYYGFRQDHWTILVHANDVEYN